MSRVTVGIWVTPACGLRPIETLKLFAHLSRKVGTGCNVWIEKMEQNGTVWNSGSRHFPDRQSLRARHMPDTAVLAWSPSPCSCGSGSWWPRFSLQYENKKQQQRVSRFQRESREFIILVRICELPWCSSVKAMVLAGNMIVQKSQPLTRPPWTMLSQGAI